MKFEEEKDGDKYHNIKDHCNQNDQQSHNNAKIATSELVDNNSNRAEKSHKCDQGKQDGVEKHQQEKFTVVKSNASIDPRTEQREIYQ